MTTVLDHLTAALKLSGEGREKLVAAMRQAKLTERDPEIVPVALMLTLRELIEQSRAELARLEHSVRANVDRADATTNKLIEALRSPARIDQAIHLIDSGTARACQRIEASGQHLEEQFDKLADLVSDARWYRWSIPLAIGFTALVVTVALYFSPGVSGYIYLRERVAAELVPGCIPVTPEVSTASNGVKYVVCR